MKESTEIQRRIAKAVNSMPMGAGMFNRLPTEPGDITLEPLAAYLEELRDKMTKRAQENQSFLRDQKTRMEEEAVLRAFIRRLT